MKKLENRKFFLQSGIFLFIVFGSITIFLLSYIRYAQQEGYYGPESDFYNTNECYELTYQYAEEIYTNFTELADSAGTEEGLYYFNKLYSEDIGNVRFTIVDMEGNTLYSNYQIGWNYGLELTVYEYDDYVSHINCYVLDPLEDTDDYYPLYKIYDRLYPFRYWVVICVALSSLVFVSSFVLTAVSIKGRQKQELNFFDRIPMDILAGTAFIISVLLLDGIYEMRDPFGEVPKTVLQILVSVMVCLIILFCYITLVKRFKSGGKGKDTLVYKGIMLIKERIRLAQKNGTFLRKIPLAGRSFILFGIFELLNFGLVVTPYGYSFYGFFSMILWLILQVVVLVVLCASTIQFRTLKQGAVKIAQGDLNYKIKTKGMLRELKTHGEILNQIGDVMQSSMEEKIKSERFKAELITNVSHDIKTPLTSIINYVDLLKKEDIKDKVILEYLDVLDRQSSRLKKLTQDLIEASKISTGNLEMNPEPTDLTELVNQSVGEYSEQFMSVRLEPIISAPYEEVKILADGQLMWRVFDNLLSNICRYSQPETRVYFNIFKMDKNAAVIFKNISRDILNISSEELMERFVRGDGSRKTQGNGLGLSIAKSLTELQKGSMELYVDGDLFKVILKFDLLD